MLQRGGAGAIRDLLDSGRPTARQRRPRQLPSNDRDNLSAARRHRGGEATRLGRVCPYFELVHAERLIDVGRAGSEGSRLIGETGSFLRTTGQRWAISEGHRLNAKLMRIGGIQSALVEAEL